MAAKATMGRRQWGCGGIQPSTQTHFQHRQVHRLAMEVEEGRHGQPFERCERPLLPQRPQFRQQGPQGWWWR